MAITVGKTAKFKGYSELEPGQDEILIAGEEINVVDYDEESKAYTVTAVEDPERADTLFADEMDEVAEKAEPAKRRTRASKAKAAETPAEAPAEEQEEAPKPAAKATKARAAKKPAAAAKAQAAEEKEPAKAAPAKTTTAPGLVILETISDMVGSNETALKSAKEIAENLARIREEEEETLFSLGGLLAFINTNRAFDSLGYEDFAAYADAELGLKKRTAEYYVRLYTELTEAGVTVKDIEGIGWTKLRSLLGVIDKSNKKELLRKAKQMSRDDLSDHMKEVRAKIGKASATSEAPRFAKFPSFKLFEDQGTAFEAAIKAAQTKFSVDNMAEALFFMATEWLQEQDADVPLADALAALNARYGTDYGSEEDEEQDEQDEQAETVAA